MNPQPNPATRCPICGKTYRRDPNTMEGVACAVLHGPGQCCHYGYIEVKQPKPGQVEPDELEAILDEVLLHAAIRRGSGDEMLRADLIEAKAALQALSSRRTAAVLENVRALYSVTPATDEDGKPCNYKFLDLSIIDDAIDKLNQEGTTDA